MQIDRNEITYRKIKHDEISLLVDYRLQFLVELQGLQTKENEQILRKELTNYFQTALSDNSFVGWIAELDSVVLGFGGMVIQKIPGNFKLTNGLEGYILNMYTIPEFRKNGICDKLIDKLVNEGTELGLNKIYLHASKDGIELYRKKGFIEPSLPELELFLK